DLGFEMQDSSNFKISLIIPAMRYLLSLAIVVFTLCNTQSQAQQRASQQQQLRANAPGGGLTPDAVLPPWPAARNPLDTIRPVTDAMLSNPPAGDWLTWRRAHDDMGFSTLNQNPRFLCPWHEALRSGSLI